LWPVDDATFRFDLPVNELEHHLPADYFREIQLPESHSIIKPSFEFHGDIQHHVLKILNPKKKVALKMDSTVAQDKFPGAELACTIMNTDESPENSKKEGGDIPFIIAIAVAHDIVSFNKLNRACQLTNEMENLHLQMEMAQSVY